ncbi:MAG: hypothetical protein WB523_15105 [Candidatus Sulfotelmatobacter sp.]
MTRIFAVALLVLSLNTVALADGGGLPPTNPNKPPQAGTILLADGGGLPPTNPTKPPQPGFAA